MKQLLASLLILSATTSLHAQERMLGSLSISFGHEGYPMESYRVYEVWGSVAPKDYKERNALGALLARNASGNFQGYGTWFDGMSCAQAVDAMRGQLAREIRKKVRGECGGTVNAKGVAYNPPGSGNVASSGSSGSSGSGIQSSSADMSQFTNNRRLGAMIVYYGTNSGGGQIRSWYVYEVRGKELTDREGLGNVLAKKMQGANAIMGFEWRPGSDCNSALAYVQGKLRQKIGGYCGGEVDTRGEATAEARESAARGTTGYHAGDATVTDNYVNTLSTYAWARVDEPIKKAADSLQRLGWKRVYAAYDHITPAMRTVNHNVAYTPGTSYTLLGTVKENEGISKVSLVAVNGSNRENPDFLYENHYAPGQAMIVPDVHGQEAMERLVFATRLDEEGKSTDGALLVYARPVDLRRDFDAILADAPSGFASLRAVARKDSKDVPYFVGAIGMGSNSRMLYQNEKGQWVYMLKWDMGAPEAAEALTKTLGIINERAKEGTYTAKEGTSNGIGITEIYDKSGKQVLKITSNREKATLRFYFHQ